MLHVMIHLEELFMYFNTIFQCMTHLLYILKKKKPTWTEHQRMLSETFTWTGLDSANGILYSLTIPTCVWNRHTWLTTDPYSTTTAQFLWQYRKHADWQNSTIQMISIITDFIKSALQRMLQYIPFVFLVIFWETTAMWLWRSSTQRSSFSSKSTSFSLSPCDASYL